MKTREKSGADMALADAGNAKEVVSVVYLREERHIVILGPEVTKEGSHTFGVPYELTNLLRLNGEGDRIVYFALDGLTDHSWTHKSLKGFAELDGRFVGCRI